MINRRVGFWFALGSIACLSISRSQAQVVDFLHELQSTNYSVAKKAISDQLYGGYYTMHYKGTVDLQHGAAEILLTNDPAGFSINTNEVIIHIDQFHNVIWHLDSMRFLDMDADKSGSVALIARCSPTVDLDPGEGVLKLPGPNTYIIAHYDYDGSVRFVHRLPVADANVLGVAFTENGDILVTGNLGTSMDIDPSSNEMIIHPIQGSSPFIVRYSPSGEVMDSKVFDTPELEGADLVTLADGSIHWLMFSGPHGPYPSSHYLAHEQDTLWTTQATSKAFHLLKLSNAFVPLGIHTVDGGYSLSNYWRLTKLSSARFALSARPQFIGDLDPGPAVVSSSGGGPFIAEYDMLGDLVWHWFPDIDGQLIISDAALSETNDLFICGSFLGEMALSSLNDPDIQLSSSGNQDGFLTKWDGSRSLVYAFDFGGTHHDHAAAVYTTVNGVWLWGDVGTPSDIQPGIEEVMVTPSASLVAFRAHYANEVIPMEIPSTERKEIDLVVIPNPTDGQCTVISSASGEMVLMDPLGRVIRTWRQTNGETRIDLSDLSPGRYALRVVDAGSNKMFWVVKY